jgi:DNA topoisomerase-1
VQLLSGRYGPYVTDGQTNASLPRSASPEELTLGVALELLKARAEKLAEGGTAPRRGGRRSAAKPPKAAKPPAAPKAKKKSARKGAK